MSSDEARFGTGQAPAERMELPHRRILASAGSGKTWQLTTRYLALLLARPDLLPESILATTFTRAAAGEIRQRVLARLAAAAIDDERGRREIEGIVGAESRRAGRRVDAQVCGELLRRMLDAADRLQIRTLDSFFFAAANGVAFELDLPQPLSPLDERGTERLRRSAIEAVAEDGPSSGEAVAALLEALADGHPARSIESLIETSVRGLLDLAEESEVSAWSWRLSPEPVLDLPAAIAAIEREIARHAEGKAIVKALAAARGKLEAMRAADGPPPLRAWSAMLDSGIIANRSKGMRTYGKAAIDEILVATLQPIVDRVLWELERAALRRTEATRRAADRVRERWAAIQREQRSTTYAEVTRRVGRHLVEQGHGELLRRMDARVEHLLLDEFQDTSREQWAALRPLASEVVAHGDGSRSFFAVGDLKQSIYGWRGGDPSILERLADRFEQGPGGVELEDETLSTSWRSAPEVLALVNGVFGGIGANRSAVRASERAAAWWSGVFATHTTQQGPGGVAELHLVPSGSGGGGDDGEAEEAESEPGTGGDPIATRVIELVRDLQRVDPNGSIGVIARRNSMVARTIATLRGAGIAASGSGGGSLRDSAAVNAILDFVRFVDQPDHSIAWFHAASSPLGAALPLDRDAKLPARRAMAATWRERLVAGGYAAALEEIGREVLDSFSSADDLRWRRLLQQAERIDAGPWARPGEFVAAMEAVRLGDAASERVSVLNIHQSKGLEFDSVIAIDLGFDLKGRGEVLVARDEAGRVERVVRRVAELDKVPALAEVVAAHDAAAVRESLCMLYVGLTRARRRLLAIVECPQKPPSEPRMTAAGVLVEGLSAGRWTPGLAWSAGDPQWRDAIATESGSATAAFERRGTMPPIEFQPIAQHRRTRRRAAASDHAPDRLSLAVAIGDPAAAGRGTALHALFETVGFIEDGVPADEELHRVLRRRVIRPPCGPGESPDAWRRSMILRFRELIAVPTIAAALHRPAADATVWCERGYASVEAGGVVRGEIDRLVACGTPGAWRSAEIVDFKSDRLPEGRDPAEWAAEKAAFYRPQLERYRDEVAKRLRLATDAIAMRLVLLEPAKVVEVR